MKCVKWVHDYYHADKGYESEDQVCLAQGFLFLMKFRYFVEIRLYKKYHDRIRVEKSVSDRQRNILQAQVEEVYAQTIDSQTLQEEFEDLINVHVYFSCP